MTDNLKPFPTYKESGIPWLGNIPGHWITLRSRYIFREVDDRSTTGTETHLSMSQRLGLVPNAHVREKRLVSESYVGAKLCKRDDLVLNRLKAHLGVFAIAREPGLVSPDYTVLRCTRAASVDYFEFTLKSPACRGELRARAKGIVEGFWRLYTDDLYAIPLPFPPADEQAVIARFLHHADRRIRRYISTKKRLIALLNEQKQAIIHRAVTRGLDPNVRLKPSGVDWLGDVPEHWEVQRLKNMVTRVTSGSRGWSNFAADQGALFIRIGNLTRGSIGLDMSDAVRLQLPHTALSEAVRSRVEPDDLLISITAFIGSVALVPKGIEEAYVSQHVACCRPRIGVANVRWVAYVLLSPVGQVHGQMCMYGGTKQGLSLDDVKNHLIVLPPRHEQDALVDWIESESMNLDRGIASARREIDLLREYRSRLIADVVTGKLDVREAAAHLPDELDEPEPLDDAEGSADDDDEAALEEASEEADA